VPRIISVIDCAENDDLYPVFKLSIRINTESIQYLYGYRNPRRRIKLGNKHFQPWIGACVVDAPATAGNATPTTIKRKK
jgi:hypothetical protein